MSHKPFSDDELVAFAAGEMSVDDAARIEAALAADPDLAGTVEALRRIVTVMRADDTEAPSGRVVARALAEARRRSRPSMADVLEHAHRIVAELVFDSRTQPALAGFRVASAAGQLAYECDAARVDIRLTPPTSADSRSWRLRGRITMHGEGRPNAVRASDLDGETLAETEADDRGRFVMELPAGVCRLQLGAGDSVVVLDMRIG